MSAEMVSRRALHLCAPLVAAVLLSVVPPCLGGEVQLRVTGRGDSEWSARNEAVRLALQQAIRQLVIADRTVSDDTVLRDSVMSTMNGFVDRFDPIRMHKEGSEIVVEANVTVSSTRIENFLGGSTGASASIRGSDLAASLQGELAARSARAQVLWRLFAGYPGKAIEIKINRVGLSAQDARLIVVDYDFTTNKTFLSSLKQGLQVLAHPPTRSHSEAESAETSDKNSNGSWIGRLGKTINEPAATQPRPASVAIPARSESPDSGVCIETPSPEPRYAGTRDCYPLPPADYRSQYPGVYNWRMFHHYMLLLVDFADEGGNSLLRRGHVLGVESGAVLLRVIPKAYSSEPALRIELTAFNGKHGRLAVPVDEITDLGRVAKVAILAVATDWSSRGVGHAAGDPYFPIDWSRTAPFTDMCQRGVLFDMPKCTPLQDAIHELRLRATP